MDLLRNVPLGLYLEQPISLLHRLDARVKLLWLSTFLLTPILADNAWRLGVVGVLIVMTLLVQVPLRVWQRQLGLVLAIATIGTLTTAIAPDGLGITPSPIRPALGLFPAADLDAAEAETFRAALDERLQTPPTPDYRYTLVSLGEYNPSQRWPPFIRITRRSLSVAIRFGTLLFTLIYSTNLFLLTTAAEDIAAALAFFLGPLKRLGAPVAELVLTLTLALRFLPLVLEEMQNIARAVSTRDIRWQMLGLKGTIQIALRLVERFLENLLQRAAQTAAAMEVRGYVGPEHAVPWQVLHFSLRDRWLLALIPLVWLVRMGLFQA